jgi:hypothetical protein
MAEEQNSQTSQASAPATTPATQNKIVSAGAPQLVRRESAPSVNPVNSNQSSTTQATQAAQQDTNTQQQAAAASAPVVTSAPSDEQMKAYFESQGIEWKGVDDIKSKLNKKSEPAPLTDEEKAAQERERENKMLQLYLKGGGKIEDFAGIKAVANQDLASLSQKEAMRELTAAGFTDEEAKSILKERYYIMTPEELSLIDDDAQRAAAKKRSDYFSKKLNERSADLQNKAKGILGDLDAALKSEEAQAQREATISSKVEDYASKVERKMTFDLGTVDGKAISPIEHSVNDTEIAAVIDTLKDPAKRNKFLYTDDGSLNVEAITNVMIKAQVLEGAVKAALLEGQTRSVKELQTVFPYNNAHAVGVGGASATGGGKTPGKIVSAGKPEVVRRAVQTK